MKRTLTLVTVLALMLCVKTFAGTASADKTQTTAATKSTPMTMSGKPLTIEDRVKHLDDKLSFTADQKTKVTAIFQNSKIQALSDKLKDKSLDKTAHQNAMMDMKAEMESVNKQIEPLLTDSQKLEFKKMQSGGQWKPAQKPTTTATAKPSGK